MEDTYKDRDKKAANHQPHGTPKDTAVPDEHDTKEPVKEKTPSMQK